jgi:hypothetical protein
LALLGKQGGLLAQDADLRSLADAALVPHDKLPNLLKCLVDAPRRPLTAAHQPYEVRPLPKTGLALYQRQQMRLQLDVDALRKRLGLTKYASPTGKRSSEEGLHRLI